MRQALEIIEVDSARMEDVLRRVEQVLDTEDSKLIRAIFASYAYVTDLVADKNTSIRRLRQLFFGAKTEKTKTLVAGPSAAPPSSRSSGVVTQDASRIDEPDQGAADAGDAADTRPASVAGPAGRASRRETNNGRNIQAVDKKGRWPPVGGPGKAGKMPQAFWGYRLGS